MCVCLEFNSEQFALLSGSSFGLSWIISQFVSDHLNSAALAQLKADQAFDDAKANIHEIDQKSPCDLFFQRMRVCVITSSAQQWEEQREELAEAIRYLCDMIIFMEHPINENLKYWKYFRWTAHATPFTVRREV